jgi:hypothetical protein
MSDPSREYNPRAHGNIYTPHAGSMIIQVARESGLQHRTFVLSPGQVRLLRFIFRSRASRIAGMIVAVLLVLVASQAARVPMLTYRIAHMEHDAARLDTLERSLAELQKRYDQVQRMLGASATPVEAFPAITDTLHHMHPSRSAQANQPEAAEPAVEPAVQPTAAPAPAARDSANTTTAPATKPADPD